MSCFRRFMTASGILLALPSLNLAGMLSCGSALADGGWMFATAEQPSAESGPQATSQPAATAAGQQRPQREPPGHIFGYPTRQDPLFDDGTRMPYQYQHLQRSRWNRPGYDTDLPQYVKPSRAQEPIRKPVYQMPLAIEPLDNKPKYTIKNYMAPSDFKPSYEFPTYMDRPSYVIKPIEKPAVNRPGYDRSVIFYDRPEYTPPVYTPEEYKPPRYAPSPFIAPPP